MEIDVEALRNDLMSESLGAFFGGGFGAALIEAIDVERASSQELLNNANQMGIDLEKYIKE